MTKNKIYETIYVFSIFKDTMKQFIDITARKDFVDGLMDSIIRIFEIDDASQSAIIRNELDSASDEELLLRHQNIKEYLDSMKLVNSRYRAKLYLVDEKSKNEDIPQMLIY